MIPIDWIILHIVRSFHARRGRVYRARQQNPSEYFVGSGKVNPVLIGVSLFATLLSRISYLAIPGEVLGKGPVYMTNYIAYPFVFLVLGLRRWRATLSPW